MRGRHILMLEAERGRRIFTLEVADRGAHSAQAPRERLSGISLSLESVPMVEAVGRQARMSLCGIDRQQPPTRLP